MGCGGGGGGGSGTNVSGNSPVTNPTVRLVERIASGFNYSSSNTNGYVVVLGSSIYVSDSIKIWSLDFSGQVNASDTQAIADSRGIAPVGSSLYYAGNPQVNPNIYVFPNRNTPQVNNLNPNYNFGSLTNYGSDLYAIDFSLGEVLKFVNKIGTGVSIASLSGASYITSDASYIYATKLNGGVTYIAPSAPNQSFSWTGLTNPKGIAIAGSYAYVVSQADNNGNGAAILRVKLSDGTVDTYVDGQTLGTWDSSLTKGFCGPTGIAANTQDGYLYVINGYCTGVTSNGNSLLRIKI